MRKLLILTFIIGFCWMGQWVLAYDDAVIEVDNHDATFYPSPGAWKTSTARILYYGDDYRAIQCSGSTGSMTAYASFVSPRTLDVKGYYSVFARWTVDPNRSKSVRYYIYKNSTDTSPLATVTVNQEVNGGEWRYLGTWQFDLGSTPKVVIANDCVHESPEGTSWVIADAVRWIKEQWSSANIVDEPGISYTHNNTYVTIDSTSESSPTQIISKSITCPRSGYVVAMATGNSIVFPTSTNVYALINYSLSPSTTWDDNHRQLIGGYFTHFNADYRSLSLVRRDSCSGGQTLTYYLLGYRNASSTSSSNIQRPNLNLTYYSTTY